MDIIISEEPCEKIKNKFEVIMNTYTKGGEIYQEYKFFVEKENIEKVCLEILIFEHQYFDHRENFAPMYDQKNYFRNNKKAFTWLNAYPDNENGEINYVLDNYDIIFHDNNGEKYPVTIKNIDNVLDEIKNINEQFQIGNEDVWYSFSSMDKKYKTYCDTMIGFIDKHLLEKQLTKEVKKNNKIKL